MDSFILKLNTVNFYNYLKNSNIHKQIARALIKLYQSTLAHFIGGHCRHYPTCSYYALAAYENLPFLQATKLVVTRVSTCHPLSKKSFFDPIPISNQKRAL